MSHGVRLWVVAVVSLAVLASGAAATGVAAGARPTQDSVAGQTVSGPHAPAPADRASNATDGEANEPPLAEAGVDQWVTENATVYLDATGSRDPDGRVVDYEWSIERPDGSTADPACAGCGETSFVAGTVGTYNVTVTVEDDDGATSRDTMRVHVEAVSGPSVSLSGESELTAGVVTTYEADVRPGDAALAEVEWRVGNETLRTESLSASDGAVTDNLSVALNETGNRTLTVRVTDVAGRTDTARLRVSVSESGRRLGGGFGNTLVCGHVVQRSWAGENSIGRCSELLEYDLRYHDPKRDKTIWFDANGEDGIQKPPSEDQSKQISNIQNRGPKQDTKKTGTKNSDQSNRKSTKRNAPDIVME